MPTTLLTGWNPESEYIETVQDLPATLASLLPTDSLVDLRLSVDLYGPLDIVPLRRMWAYITPTHDPGGFVAMCKAIEEFETVMITERPT